MALLWGRARLGALTLAYPHTPPFLSWGRFEECVLLCPPSRNGRGSRGSAALPQRTGAQQLLEQVVWSNAPEFPEA